MLEQFDAFRDKRLKSEKSELTEGVPMAMPPLMLFPARRAFEHGK